MKILHLFSNWKWTGPAEPAVNLCRMLGDRHDITFIPGGHPRSFKDNEVARNALERGIEPVKGFFLEKHFHAFHNLEDVMRLRNFLLEREFDLIHTHMTNDHFVAACALRTLGKRTPVVRSFYDPDNLANSIRARWMLRRFTQGAMVITERARKSLIDKNFLSSEKVMVSPGAVDTERFDPSTVDRAAARASLGVAGSEFLFVIVARMQRHRKFDVLLRAFKRASDEEPALRLLIVGRGTHQEEVVRQPVREIGLAEKVIFSGYLRGRNFVAAVAAADCSIFMIPGSDGSCRAVREKMSLGLPVIASRMPPLDEIVDEGRTGFLVEPVDDDLAGALLGAARDRDATAAMGRQARRKAVAEYALEVQAARVEECYRSVLGD